jgi:amino acid permease
MLGRRVDRWLWYACLAVLARSHGSTGLLGLGALVIKNTNKPAAARRRSAVSKPRHDADDVGDPRFSSSSSRRCRHPTAIAVLADNDVGRSGGDRGASGLATPPKSDQQDQAGGAFTAAQLQQEQQQERKTWLLQASLIKSIVGVGALALPAAVAAVGGAEALSASIVMIGLAAAMNAYSFSLLGRVCEATGARSYLEAWENTMGQDSVRSTNVVSVILSLKTALACLAYSMTLADSLHSLVADISRTEALIGVTCLALAPLCLLPNLTALAPFSLVGVLGILLTTAFMLLRLLDGTYSADPIMNSENGILTMISSDAWADGGLSTLHLHLADFSATTGEASVLHTDPLDLIGLACTLATTFVCHYNGPRLYTELQENQSVFQRLTVTSFATGAMIIATIATAGFLTFGQDSAPVILSNYSTGDSLMALSRVLIMASIVATFPLAFLGLRDSLRDKWPWDDKWSLSFGLLLSITLVASSFDDLGLLLKVGGGTVSTAVASVIPSLMYLKCWPSAKLPKVLCATATVVGITGVTNTLLTL